MMGYTQFFKGVFQKFMGRASFTVLEYHLSKRLSGADPFELLLDEPNAFYEALASIFGAEGSLLFLKTVFKQIVNGYQLNNWNAEEFAELLARGGREARESLMKLLESLPITENT